MLPDWLIPISIPSLAYGYVQAIQCLFEEGKMRRSQEAKRMAAEEYVPPRKELLGCAICGKVTHSERDCSKVDRRQRQLPPPDPELVHEILC